jgi:hypothetical protein
MSAFVSCTPSATKPSVHWILENGCSAQHLNSIVQTPQRPRLRAALTTRRKRMSISMEAAFDSGHFSRSQGRPASVCGFRSPQFNDGSDPEGLISSPRHRSEVVSGGNSRYKH